MKWGLSWYIMTEFLKKTIIKYLLYIISYIVVRLGYSYIYNNGYKIQMVIKFKFCLNIKKRKLTEIE